MKEKQTMHALGCFVHGVLVAFHSLALVYNLKRGNYIQAGVHTAVAGYDLWAVNHHLGEIKEEEEIDVLHGFV